MQENIVSIKENTNNVHLTKRLLDEQRKYNSGIKEEVKSSTCRACEESKANTLHHEKDSIYQIMIDYKGKSLM